VKMSYVSSSVKFLYTVKCLKKDTCTVHSELVNAFAANKEVLEGSYTLIPNLDHIAYLSAKEIEAN